MVSFRGLWKVYVLMAMGTYLFILLTFLVEVIIVSRAQGGGGICLRQQSKTVHIFPLLSPPPP